MSCAGILNPSFRGGFISMGFALFIFGGILAGYYSSRLYKTFGGTSWKTNVLFVSTPPPTEKLYTTNLATKTSTFVPGLLFATLFTLNLLVWAQSSSSALPFTTLLALLTLWSLVQTPLVYLGGYLGTAHAKPYAHPIKPSPIPRQLPPNAWWATPAWGLVPFAVVLVELMYVFRSVWQDKTGYYYLFGFLGAVSAVLAVTIAQVAIVATYMQLCREDYRWWWASFATGASSAPWIFVYCAYYYFFKLSVYGLVSGVLFFGYCALACALYALLTGTVGFLTAYAFVRRIYGAIKVD